MIPHFAEYGVIFIFFRRKVFLKTDGGKTGQHLVKKVKRDLEQIGFGSADRAGVVDIAGVYQKDISCVQQKGFLAAEDMHGAGGDVEDLDMCVPVAWDELVVGLVDVKIDGEFGFGGDDFVGGHGGGDSFLLGEIDWWHAGVLASLPAVCMAPECPGKAEPVTAFSCS